MGKIIRNSVFTLIALGLAAIGLNWNRQVAQETDPVQISATVLSAVEAGSTQSFPLTIQFARPRVKLGEYQELQISTVPNAKLSIATVYPSGEVNNPQTLSAVADETGSYSLKFRLNDFSDLGVFESKVIARSGRQQHQASARFALQTLIGTGTSGSDNGYLYPLLP